jgi:alanine racemase
MDQIVVDISAVDGVKDGDEAVLIGRQGEHAISANDLAEQSGTIAWDVLTGIGRRVERFYSGAAANGL